MDAAEYKHLVLGLIFVKYISDTFAARRAELRPRLLDPDDEYFYGQASSEDIDAELDDRDYYREVNVFWVPEAARWEALRAADRLSRNCADSDSHQPRRYRHVAGRPAAAALHALLVSGKHGRHQGSRERIDLHGDQQEGVSADCCIGAAGARDRRLSGSRDGIVFSAGID